MGSSLNPFNAKGEAQNSTAALSDASGSLLSAASPLISQISNAYTGLLSGTPTEATNQMIAPINDSIANQYSAGRNSIIESSGSRGGQLSSQLTNSYLGEANSRGNVMGNLIQQALTGGGSFSSGLANAAMGGYSNAANASNAQTQTGKQGLNSLMSGAGSAAATPTASSLWSSLF